jgi:GDP-4-dehydro-6-deoxy-D-mannose reductase
LSDSPTILITGIAGFVGSHLAEYLAAHFPELTLYGSARNSVVEENPNLAHLPPHRLKLFEVDLADFPALKHLIADLSPDYVFHLAARSHVAPSFKDPATTLLNNIKATLNLFEALRAAGIEKHCKVLNAGSSDQYGKIEPQELPIKESQPFRPTNPYAVSKISQEMLGYQYHQAYTMPIYLTRGFNQIGRRQNPELALSAFARQIAQAEAGLIEPVIRVGNLSATRDYTDVRDIVRACWLAVSHPNCQPGQPYNLCSGKDWQMSALLNMMLEQARVVLEVQSDPAKMRPADIMAIRGDYSLFHAATGWQPTISLAESIHELLDFWREQVKN